MYDVIDEDEHCTGSNRRYRTSVFQSLDWFVWSFLWSVLRETVLLMRTGFSATCTSLVAGLEGISECLPVHDVEDGSPGNTVEDGLPARQSGYTVPITNACTNPNTDDEPSDFHQACFGPSDSHQK